MPRNHIVYKSNGPISGLRNNGKKTEDDYTCGPTYENFIVTDDYGAKVDSRRPNGRDIDQKEGGFSAIAISPYFPAGSES
jgi:hypothetical protein